MHTPKYISLAAAMLFTMAAHAQEATAPGKGNLSFVEIFMATVAIILAFVIWGLGNILITFARQVFEKSQSGNGSKTAAIITVLLMLSVAGYAQDAPAAASAGTAFNYGGLSATTFWLLVSVIVTEFVVIFALVFNIQRLHNALIAQKKPAVAKMPVLAKTQSWLISTWHYLDRRFFTKAPPVEQEADIMLDHDYDGIKELDNALPPWWKYGFYVTIVVAIIYLLRFHVWGTGPSPEEEYAAEMKAAQLQLAAYMAKAKDLVDENNVTMADAAGIEEGKILFAKTCVACHGAAGEGTVGPNLTDDYWLHGGSLNQIFKSIKYGYPEKGMQAWESQYSPKQIRSLASYIKTLHGTNPANAKAPQGELYKEEAAPAADSAAAKTVAIQ